MGETPDDAPPTVAQAPHPDFQLHDDGNGIEIKGWSIKVGQHAIANSSVEDQLTHQLGIKLPGMLFDKSSLSLRYGDKSQVDMTFNAVDALRMVGESDPNIKVKAAEIWRAKKSRPGVEITTIEGASDWTFSTRYAGTIHVNGSGIRNDVDNVENGTHEKTVILSQRDGDVKPIDFVKLRDTSLPILFTSQVILFEDELDDNGTASYKVRIRVMPTFMFILARFFLRVDGVLIRIYDTRYYHEFGSDVIVQESVTREVDLGTSLKDAHPSILRDPDMVAQRAPISASQLLNIRLSSPAT